MHTTIFVDILGYLAGICLMVSFTPQVWKMFTTRSTKDVSWLMLVMTLATAMLYEIYAYLLGLVPVMIMNGLFGVTVGWALVLKARYDEPDPARKADVASCAPEA